MKTFKITYEDSTWLNIPADIENPSIEYIMAEFRRHVECEAISKIEDEATGEVVFEHKEYTEDLKK